MGTEKFTEFFNNERGVTAIEYALIASLIFLAIVGAAGAMAERVGILYQQIAAAL
jgi:pilus assembly protein Flp/PilA